MYLLTRREQNLLNGKIRIVENLSEDGGIFGEVSDEYGRVKLRKPLLNMAAATRWFVDITAAIAILK